MHIPEPLRAFTYVVYIYIYRTSIHAIYLYIHVTYIPWPVIYLFINVINCIHGPLGSPLRGGGGFEGPQGAEGEAGEAPRREPGEGGGTAGRGGGRGPGVVGVVGVVGGGEGNGRNPCRPWLKPLFVGIYRRITIPGFLNNIPKPELRIGSPSKGPSWYGELPPPLVSSL